MKSNKKRSLFAQMSKRLVLFLFSLFSVLLIGANAQNKTITGNVTDKAGESIIGASVIVKGTINATITDINGDFTLQNVPPSGTIQVSCIGYATQDVSVAGKNSIKVMLSEDEEELEEIVVVGYGVRKKSDITGSIASIGAKELTARPVNNAFEAMQGKIAGVDITTNERPGQIGTIRIRGNRSLVRDDADKALNDPLYVVDGVPLMSASAIESLNTRDIESIDVLKDASATAIYGSRGANGVIIVTTKQGKPGTFSLEYSGSLTTSNLVDKSPSMSASEFIEFRRWAAYNLDQTKYAHPSSPTYENDVLIFDSALDGQTSRDNILKGWTNGQWNPSLVSNTDWTDFVTQTSLAHEHVLSASGGTEQLYAYGSFGYLSNEGTQKGQWYDRYTGKLSVNIKPVDWFNFTASMNVSWSEQDFGLSTLGGRSGTVPNTIYQTAKSIYNMAVPYDADNNRVINPGGESAIYTIMEEWNHSTQQSQTLRALGNFSGTVNLGEIWKPLQGLQYKINFGPDFRHWREGSYIDGQSSHKINADGSSGKSYARLKNQRDFSWTLDNMIIYDKTVADKHKIGLTLLQTASSWNYEFSEMSANNIPRSSYLWNAFGSIDITNSDNSAAMSSGIIERQLESYMFRINYGYDDRYLLTMSVRWDGASQLAPEHQWDTFPSVAIAWRMNQEDFLKDIVWLDNLKLRAGLGTTGNSAVKPYATKGDITSIYVPFNGLGNQLAYTTNEPYYSNKQLTMANDKLGWEKTTQYNIGIDFGVLKNRIGGSIDTYFSRTSDLLMLTNIPTLTGFPNTYANIGKTKNHGVELSLNFIPVQLKNGFEWVSNINMAYQKDEIAELAYGKNDMVDNAWFIGESINVYYGYEHNGLWQDTPEDLAEMEKWKAKGYDFTPGNVRPKDQNGDYVMDINDRIVLGNQDPRWTMGWNNSFNWKGIDLGVSLYGRMGYMIDGLGEALTAHSNQRKIGYWTPDNTNAEYQKPILGQATSGSQDDFSGLLAYKDASFIKIRNISLGYNFPKKLTNRMNLKRLKVYAQAVNPGSIYQSIDGYDLDTRNTFYNRSFVFGLEVGF